MYVVQYNIGNSDWDNPNWGDLSEWDSYAAADAEISELLEDNPFYEYRIVED